MPELCRGRVNYIILLSVGGFKEKVMLCFPTGSFSTNESPNIRILHHSDLHFRTTPTDTFNSGLVIKSLLSKVGEFAPLDFIIITGDFTGSVSEDGFTAAKQFCKGLLTVSGLIADRIFLVPGDHDIDKSKIEK